MGDEIPRRHFSAEDFSVFRFRLDEETKLLAEQFALDRFSHRGDIAGFELEAWLVDRDGNPLPRNQDYLERLNNPLVVPELASFNVELNGSPSALAGRVFSRLEDELAATWQDCRNTAEAMGFRLATIGILPTIHAKLLNSEHMSRMVRYQALNDRVMALRDGKPLHLEIEGGAGLSMRHPDVMLEAAATSFQIHLQCKPENAVRDFNATLAMSAPMVAACANSPVLFGRALWDETRIPLFEQAVDLGSHYPARVSFGNGFVSESVLEMFLENQQHPILMPHVSDAAPSKFSHARFHNGTIWRWNRPLIGFDHDGQAHLRIEHRVVPAGPSIRDCVANAALFFGLVRGLGLDGAPPVQERLSFATARDNFYNTARYGLGARVGWNGSELGVRDLLLQELLPLARQGLANYGIPEAEIDQYLGVVEARVESTQNGAAWQKRWIMRNGLDANQLVLAYLERQEGGEPVHAWPL